tara:strand:- start:758 stop:982 length:225 start_codon:yes stop_codon:yes gene_type:complete
MMAQPFVEIGDVASHFKVSVSTVRAWVRQGQIPPNTYVKLGKTFRFQLDAVADALLNGSAVSESEPEIEIDEDL